MAWYESISLKQGLPDLGYEVQGRGKIPFYLGSGLTYSCRHWRIMCKSDTPVLSRVAHFLVGIVEAAPLIGFAAALVDYRSHVPGTDAKSSTASVALLGQRILTDKKPALGPALADQKVFGRLQKIAGAKTADYLTSVSKSDSSRKMSPWDQTCMRFGKGLSKELCTATYEGLKTKKWINDQDEMTIGDRTYRVLVASAQDDRHTWLQLAKKDKPIPSGGIYDFEDEDPIVIEPSYLQFMGKLKAPDDPWNKGGYEENSENKTILNENPAVFVGRKSLLLEKIRGQLPRTNRDREDQAEISRQWSMGYTLSSFSKSSLSKLLKN